MLMGKCVSLNRILFDLDYEIIMKGKIKYVNGISVNSKLVEAGNMFIALKGVKTDGHLYIGEAYEKGAKFFVVNEDMISNMELNDLSDVTVIKVKNTRESLSILIKNFYKNPSEKFKLVGVTGTNGKTSITTIANYVFTKLGFNTGLIGTIDNYIKNKVMHIEKTNPTTPDCVELGKIIDAYVREDVDYAFMEVSSMALKTHRVDNCQFETVVFSNLSPEHLDDHKTMEDYVNSKLRLFTMADKAVVNVDDEYSTKVLEKCQGKVIRYGIKNIDKCDLYAKDINFSWNNVSFTVVYLDEEYELTINTPSEFAIYNNLAVIGICIMSGLNLEKVIDVLQDPILIEGRFDVVKTEQPFSVIIDYAHTQAALENLLKAVRKNDKYNRVITIFGCGGDRDRSKRSVMGRISQELSDITIITSDNPRSENPESIIQEILSDIKDQTNVYTVIDRREAIEFGINMAGDGDVVLIVGKGHEKVQEYNGYSVPFSDKDVVKEVITKTFIFNTI